MTPDPFPSITEHHRAAQREAQLAAEQIGYGVSVLGKATHAATGRYAQAFFALSIGVERMGKLVFIADHAIAKAGVFPTDEDLRGFGHDIPLLLDKCEEIADKLDSTRKYRDRPNDPIHRGIAECLSLFSDKTRYYNLNYLAGKSSNQNDPIALWWEKVAVPICNRHYSAKQRHKDQEEGRFMEAMIGETATVFHTAEDGEPIRDIQTLCSRRNATRVVQKYGRMYTLQIVRWMSSIMIELAHTGAYGKRIEALLGLHEPFTMFYNEDCYLRERKRWSNYC